MTNTIKKNAYLMLILAGIALLVLANLSQPATAFDRPSFGDCADKDWGFEDGKHVVTKWTNTCKESWRVKYFYYREPNTPYEQVVKMGESIIIHEREDSAWAGIGCPSTDDTLLAVDSYDAVKEFKCAWR